MPDLIPAMAPATAPHRSNGQTLIALLGLGAAGFIAYRYVYLPYKLRSLIAAQAAAAGLTYDAYLAKIGAVACQGLGAYYGIPPSVTGGVCGSVGQVAAQAAASLPGILSGVGAAAASSTVAAGNALQIALPAVGKGVGGLFSGVAGGVGGAVRSLTDASVYGSNAALGVVSKAGSTVKSGIEGASLLPIDVAKKTASSIGSGAKAAGHFIASIF